MVCMPETTVFVLNDYDTSDPTFIADYNYSLRFDGMDSVKYPSRIYLPYIPCTLECCSSVTFAAHAVGSTTPLGTDLVKSVKKVTDSADAHFGKLVVELNVNIDTWTSTDWIVNATNAFFIVASVSHGNYTKTSLDQITAAGIAPVPVHVNITYNCFTDLAVYKSVAPEGNAGDWIMEGGRSVMQKRIEQDGSTSGGSVVA